jgi:flagellar basal-body rod protein FlgB
MRSSSSNEEAAVNIQVEAVTTAALSLALRVASQRQQAIAANIAHAGTTGFTPADVTFGDALAQARLELSTAGSIMPDTLAGLRPDWQARLDTQGQPETVRLDSEAALLAGNAVHYQALVQGLSRHLGLLALAAGDGKR